jgi:hypothetical protein
VFSALSAGGLVGNNDAALEQHFFDVAQAQIETEVEPDSTGHDFNRVGVVLVSRRSSIDAPLLL